MSDYVQRIDKAMGEITRGDFINGTLLATGAMVLPFGSISEAPSDSLDGI